MAKEEGPVVLPREVGGRTRRKRGKGKRKREMQKAERERERETTKHHTNQYHQWPQELFIKNHTCRWKELKKKLKSFSF